MGDGGEGSGREEELVDLLDKVEHVAQGKDRVAFRDIHEAFGARSFGPLLTITGLIAASPLGGLPGLPTAMAVVVVLISAQLVLGRRSFWLPKFIADRKIDSGKLQKFLRFMRRPAGFVDRILHPRLLALTSKLATRIAAMVCLLIGLVVPPLELAPFAVLAPGAAITAFGLGLTARDGLLVLIAFIASALSLGLVGVLLLR